MIFTGDVAIAEGDHFVFNGFPQRVRELPMCINLEGAIKPDGVVFNNGVYNSESGMRALSVFNLTHPFVANNHIHDLNDGLRLTKRFFELKGLNLVGNCVSPLNAENDTLVLSRGINYRVLGFGWPVIGCKPSTSSAPGVKSFHRKNVVAEVDRALLATPSAEVVVVIHGNYEFELYPQPGHRKLALELIDMGVYAVIFHHPHIVGPIERYKGRTIAYSLGNWAFSSGRFFRNRLIFPPSTYHQIAIELASVETGEDKIHHAMFVPPSRVDYVGSEDVSSDGLSLIAEFEGFSESEYLSWFKVNRKKNKFLPIYTDASNTLSNRFKDGFVLFRQGLINLAVKSGIKSLRRT